MYLRISGSLTKKPDEVIWTETALLLEKDRRNKADFLAYLNEIDRRRLYAKDGYSSLFRLLTEKYRMSESSALKRIQVARLAKKFPFLYRDIADGLYSLSALSRLAPFLKGYNSARLLKACEHQPVRAVESLLAKEFPKADVEDQLQKKISSLGPDRVHIQFTTDNQFVSDLDKARALLSHRFPQGKLGDVIGLALKTLLAQLEKPVRSAKADRRIPRGMQIDQSPARRTQGPAGSLSPNIEPEGLVSNVPNPSAKQSRYIPRGIQRAVYQRDGGKCQHLRPDGSLCAETHFLEVDHIQPFARGGGSGFENLRLLCWAHNQLRAEAEFGRYRKRAK